MPSLMQRYRSADDRGEEQGEESGLVVSKVQA